ncbi:hypothetical protein [Nocardiopsis baichengensis]|uniref:hypothetical protein n=1 Tax=Nocardiopsis baichengensis TaxID=280240 RepID=UPI0012691B04|nr:hypothetical protein [Nocardiopsis baichengensis]
MNALRRNRGAVDEPDGADEARRANERLEHTIAWYASHKASAGDVEALLKGVLWIVAIGAWAWAALVLFGPVYERAVVPMVLSWPCTVAALALRRCPGTHS